MKFLPKYKFCLLSGDNIITCICNFEMFLVKHKYKSGLGKIYNINQPNCNQ